LKFRPRCMFAVLAAFMLTAGVFLPARAESAMKIVSVPGHPVFLLLETSDGVISSALMRSPAGIQKILPLEGLCFRRDSYVRTFADGDLSSDLVWTLTFTHPSDQSRGIQVWIGITTLPPKAWVSLSPVGQTYWDTIPVNLYVPRGISLYVSPNLPAYGELPQFGGNRTLTFVYTIALTPEGPNFVVAPEVYRQLLKITHLVSEGESFPQRRQAYGKILEDYETLSRGGKPSNEAIQNFSWKKLFSVEWR